MAVVIGAAGIGRWQAAEIRSAITLSVKHNVPVIPVLLPGVNELPPTIPFLSEFNWVRFVETVDEEVGVERLFWGVMGRRPPSASRENGVAAVDQQVIQVARKPTSTNPGVGIPGRSGRVVFGLHGIRTHAAWARLLYEVGAEAAWQVRMDRWNFGYFSLFQFLSPWARRAKIQWFRRAYSEEMENRKVLLAEGKLPSIVAHSFGTYILGNALLKYDWLRFNKVILCGSILPHDFPWDKLIERGQVQAVRNEYGVKDVWTGVVRWFVARTGPSGRKGFLCRHERFEQEEFNYEHSEYFDRGHMGAKWLPFLNRSLPPIPPSTGPVTSPKMIRPWGLYAIYGFLLFAVAACTASPLLGRMQYGDRDSRTMLLYDGPRISSPANSNVTFSEFLDRLNRSRYTALQVAAFLDEQTGKRVTWTGHVRDAVDHTSGGLPPCVEMARIHGFFGDMRAACYFSNDDEEELRSIALGGVITLSGTLVGIDHGDIVLKDCTLVEVGE